MDRGTPMSETDLAIFQNLANQDKVDFSQRPRETNGAFRNGHFDHHHRAPPPPPPQAYAQPPQAYVAPPPPSPAHSVHMNDGGGDVVECVVGNDNDPFSFDHLFQHQYECEYVPSADIVPSFSQPPQQPPQQPYQPQPSYEPPQAYHPQAQQQEYRPPTRNMHKSTFSDRVRAHLNRQATPMPPQMHQDQFYGQQQPQQQAAKMQTPPWKQPDFQYSIQNNQNNQSQQQQPEQQPQPPQQQQYQEPQGGGGGQSQRPEPVLPFPVDTEEEIAEKQVLLIELNQLKNQPGVELTQKFDMNSSIFSMKIEIDRQKQAQSVKNTVSFASDALRMILKSLEVANKQFGPFLAIDGWADTVTQDPQRFNYAIEKVYLKYFRKSEPDPVFQLALLIVGSLLLFHFNNKLGGKLGFVGSMLGVPAGPGKGSASVSASASVRSPDPVPQRPAQQQPTQQSYSNSHSHSYSQPQYQPPQPQYQPPQPQYQQPQQPVPSLPPSMHPGPIRAPLSQEAAAKAGTPGVTKPRATLTYPQPKPQHSQPQPQPQPKQHQQQHQPRPRPLEPIAEEPEFLTEAEAYPAEDVPTIDPSTLASILEQLHPQEQAEDEGESSNSEEDEDESNDNDNEMSALLDMDTMSPEEFRRRMNNLSTEQIDALGRQFSGLVDPSAA